MKAPKAQADALTWIKATMNEFGIAGIPLRDLIAFVKTALGNANALVRGSATQLLVAIRVFVGAGSSKAALPLRCSEWTLTCRYLWLSRRRQPATAQYDQL